MLVLTWFHNVYSDKISSSLFKHDFTMFVQTWSHHTCSVMISPYLFSHNFIMLVYSTSGCQSILFSQGPSTSVLVNILLDIKIFLKLRHISSSALIHPVLICSSRPFTALPALLHLFSKPLTWWLWRGWRSLVCLDSLTLFYGHGRL